MRPRFIVDVMLGNLCRWLRMLGYDTLFPEGIDDTDILNTAMDEDRILVTRDSELYERARGAVPAIFIRERKTEKQLLRVVKSFSLKISFPPETLICPLCNGFLSETDERTEKCAGKETVWKCGSCGKLYWEGSHWRRILKTVDTIRKATGVS